VQLLQGHGNASCLSNPSVMPWSASLSECCPSLKRQPSDKEADHGDTHACDVSVAAHVSHLKSNSVMRLATATVETSSDYC
jgi:hypothetical protein